MAGIGLAGVAKTYPDGHRAVTDLSLDAQDGEFLVIVGPSGCGKSTILRMIAGLEEISSGHIRIGENIVNHIPSRDRDVAMVFQSYALYPHLSVGDNIAFGLKMRRTPSDVIAQRVADTAKTLGIDDQLDRKPHSLSGGQRQRVAMGRAMVRQPQCFLMDEPLASLDAQLRVQMRTEIGYVQQRLGTTTMYVTHDQNEAMTLGTRVAVMADGALQQIGAPQHVYDHPANTFVAGFIGSPAMNLLRVRPELDGDTLSIVLGSHRILLAGLPPEQRPAVASRAGGDLMMGVRPEDLSTADLQWSPADATFAAPIRLIEHLGSEIIAHLEIDGDTTVRGRFNPRTAVRTGDTVRVRVNTQRLHWFDSETGAAIWP